MGLPSYISVDTEVEARNGDDDAWRRGKVAAIDYSDDVFPYRVTWADEDGYDWIRPDSIRVIPSEPEPPKVKQYRFRSGTRWLDWHAYSDDQVLPIMHTYTAVQFRETAPRTEAEVLAELRKYTGEQKRRGNSVDPRFARILEGNF